MKSMQSQIKPIKIGKQPKATYCFGCKDYMPDFQPEKVKMTNKVLREKAHCVVCQCNKWRFLKQKHNTRKQFSFLQTDVIKIRWTLIAWSVERILKYWPKND